MSLLLDMSITIADAASYIFITLSQIVIAYGNTMQIHANRL